MIAVPPRRWLIFISRAFVVSLLSFWSWCITWGTQDSYNSKDALGFKPSLLAAMVLDGLAWSTILPLAPFIVFGSTAMWWAQREGHRVGSSRANSVCALAGVVGIVLGIVASMAVWLALGGWGPLLCPYAVAGAAAFIFARCLHLAPALKNMLVQFLVITVASIVVGFVAHQL